MKKKGKIKNEKESIMRWTSVRKVANSVKKKKRKKKNKKKNKKKEKEKKEKEREKRKRKKKRKTLFVRFLARDVAGLLTL